MTSPSLPRPARFVWLWVLVLTAISGCGSRPPERAFDKVANSRMRSILLLEVPETQLSVLNQGSPWDAFGLIGAAIESNDEQDKSSEFDAAVRERLRLGQSMTTFLEAELKRRGFEVKVDRSQRPDSDAGPDTAPANETFDYSALETSADAILNVVMLRAGYLSTAGSSDYRQWIYVRAELVSGREKSPLYSQFLVFGVNFPETKAHLPPERPYAYGTFDALMTNREAAAVGLEDGSRMVATAIAQQLR